MSLRKIVEIYGFGYRVQSADRRFQAFVIDSEYDHECYLVIYDDGREGAVLKECESTNDYELV